MKFLLNSAKYLKYILLLLGVLIFALIMIFDSSTGRGEDGTFVGPILIWAEILLIIAAILAIALPCIGIAQNPKGAGKSLYGVIAMVVIIAIAWMCSKAEPIILANGSTYDDVTGLLVSDIAIFTTYICASIAIIAIIGTEIYKSLK